MPRIIPRRTMRLEDERVEAGKAVEVSEAAAELALRHGWADEAPAKAPRKPTAAPAPVADADPAAAQAADADPAAAQAADADPAAAQAADADPAAAQAADGAVAASQSDQAPQE